MKISETTAYPHPVLAPWSDDIADASFEVTIAVRVDEANNQVAIHIKADLEHAGLAELIEEGSAGFGCFITCRETGFRRLQKLGFPVGVHDFAPGALLGPVRLRPMIWAAEEVPGYAPEGANAEFDLPGDVGEGQILALAEEQSVLVLRPPIASVESIFEIQASPELEPGAFSVDLESDRVIVWMHQSYYELVQSLRQTDDATRAVVKNALFVPVIMEMLHSLSDDTEQYEQRRWYEPFQRRCLQVKVDPSHANLLTDAHKVLGTPFEELSTLVSLQDETDDD